MTVSAQEVRLVLSELPLELVAAGSTFPVTVGTEPEVPAGTTVTVTVTVRLAAFSSEPVALTPDAPTARVVVTAPDVGGPAVLRAEGAETADSVLDLIVLPADPMMVTVQEQVQLSLQLEAPAAVTARDTFAVTVSTQPEVPEGTTVTVTVNFDGADSEPMTLSAEMSSAVFTLRAPGLVDSTLVLTASRSGEVEVAEPDLLQVTVVEATAAVTVVAQQVQLTLMAVPDRVNIGADVEVTVGVEPVPLADTTLTVAVFFGASSQQVTLTDRASSQELRFTASAVGLLEVSARARAVDVEPAGLVVAASATETVEVLAAGTVVLTLAAPASVTVGDTITVTVGVAAGTPLTDGMTVTATLSFAAGTADSDEQEVMLTFGASTATERFTAPIRAGTVRVAVSGAVSGGTVRGASASVTVEPVAVMLQLSGPDTVIVGQTYQVTVDTNRPVPQGSTLEVTVSVSTEPQEPQVVFLAGDSSGVATFTAPMRTAPMRTDQVSVTAMATPDTAADALEVAASAADTLTVAVSALDVQLVLVPSELPSAPVAVGSTFPVTVATVPALPAGAAVTVTLILADLPGVEVELRPGASTQSVAVTAPAEAGPAPLLAEGVEAASSMLELDVLAATATVQVTELRDIMLTVSAQPSVTVVGSTIMVTVGVAEGMLLPLGAMVTATISFPAGTADSTQQVVVLTSDDPAITVIFMAPVTAGDFTVAVSGNTDDVSIDEVLSASAQVTAEAVMLALELELIRPGRSDRG